MTERSWRRIQVPTVVNCRRKRVNDPSILYCARAWAGWTGSVLGSPFHLKNREDDAERAEAIDRYRGWLLGQLDEEPVLAALSAIKEDSLLGCWCVPKACHCDVIITIWRRLKLAGML